MIGIRLGRIGFVRAAAGVAAGLLLAGCATSSSSPSAPPSGPSGTLSGTPSAPQGSGGGIGTTLFPITVGDTWVYNETLAGHQAGTLTNMIAAATPYSGGQKVMITTHSDIAGLPTTPTTLTYLFHPDGSIQVPYAQVGNNAVTIKSGGIVWPPAAQLASGQPRTSVLTVQIKAAGQDITAQAHVTVQGAGTQSVTVPAGSYQATVVQETITEHFAGIGVTIEVRTWLASGVGPVKSVVSTKSGSISEVVSTQVLKSFTKG